MLLVAQSGQLDGKGRLLLDFAPALDGEVCLACPDGGLAEHARRSGLRVFPLRAGARAPEPLATAVQVAAHAHDVRRLINGLRPAVVVSWGTRAAVACEIAAPRRPAGPRLVFQHLDPGAGRPVRTAARGADRVVVLSGAAARDLDPRGALGERLQVVPPGIHTERFRQGKAQFTLDRARERWRRTIDAPTARPAEERRRRGEGLALVTVAHNSATDLDRLLESVARHLPAARVVVVDAGSTDPSIDVARRWAGEATVLELDNVGFGRASNRGLDAVSVPVTALLNPDVELVDDSLATLAAEAARVDRPERLLAPLVLMPNGRRQDSVQSEPVSLPEIVHALVPDALLPGPLAVPLARWRSNRPRRVGWAIAACLVARTKTLRRLGPFDERIFLYGEDLDLGLRARDHGVETWFWPQARIVHRRAHATERAFGGEAFELLARRRREVIARTRGVRRAKLDDWVQLVTIADRIVIKSVLGRPTARERRQLAVARRVRREPLPGAGSPTRFQSARRPR